MGAGLLLASACDWRAQNTAVDDATLGEKITSVRVNNEAGRVTIRAGERTTVHREVHYDRDKPGATHRVEGDTLVIDSCPTRNCWINYEVTVPAGVRVDGSVDSGSVEVDGVASVNLKVDSGGVTVRKVAGRVNLDSDSGRVHLADIGDAVAVRSGSGSVTVENARAAVTAETSSGSLQLRGVGGPAAAHSDSGSVSVQLTAVHSVQAKSDSGAVRVTVPRGAYQVVTSSDSGSVHSDVASEPGANHRLELNTDSGAIELRYA